MLQGQRSKCKLFLPWKKWQYWFWVLSLLHARDQLKNDLHLPDHRERVCSSFIDENTVRSNIIVQDFGQLQGVRQATHAFGHLLGADDDGHKAGCASSEDGYIMTRNIMGIGTINNHKWSDCSVNSITSYIQNAGCLNNLPFAGFKLPPSSSFCLCLDILLIFFTYYYV